VVLLTLKRAEDGDGYIVRLIETEGKEGEAEVALPYLTILRALETNLVEENQRPLPCARHVVKVILKPFAIATIRLAAG
jgi:alpha-mannosidase